MSAFNNCQATVNHQNLNIPKEKFLALEARLTNIKMANPSQVSAKNDTAPAQTPINTPNPAYVLEEVTNKRNAQHVMSPTTLQNGQTPKRRKKKDSSTQDNTQVTPARKQSVFNDDMDQTSRGSHPDTSLTPTPKPSASKGSRKITDYEIVLKE